MAPAKSPRARSGKRNRGTDKPDAFMRWGWGSMAGQESAADPAMSPDYWRDLNPNDRVIIQRPGEAPVAATVDIVAPAADTLWVWQDKGFGRIIIHASDHVRVWKSGQTAYAADKPALPVYAPQGLNPST